MTLHAMQPTSSDPTWRRYDPRTGEESRSLNPRAFACSGPEPSLERTEMSCNSVKLISIASDITRLSGTSSGTDISLARLRIITLSCGWAVTCGVPTLRSISLIYHRLTVFLRDSKSVGGNSMGVQLLLPAPYDVVVTALILRGL